MVGEKLLLLLRSADPAAVPAILKAHPEEVRDMGVARRMRILSWLAFADADRRGAFEELSEDEGKGSGASSHEQEVVDLFKADRLMVQKCLGNTLAKGMIAATGDDILAATHVPSRSMVAIPPESLDGENGYVQA